jgi:hypothetical protein
VVSAVQDYLEREKRRREVLRGDPLAALAKMIGQDDAFAALRKWEPPNVRQIPFRYHTKEHGPVFAYMAKAGHAECVTWLDATVLVAHNDLLPFDPTAEGAELISDLEWDVLEAASPHPYKPLRRKSRIGAYIFNMPHIWNAIIQPE